MMDKFIFYSTLKVSLSSGINSIWRSRFDVFWKKKLKAVLNENLKGFFLKKNIFICHVLDSSYQRPGYRPGPNCKTAVVFYILTGLSEVFTNVPGCCSRISKEETNWSATRGSPMHLSRLRSSLKNKSAIMSWKNRAVSLLHVSKTSPYNAESTLTDYFSMPVAQSSTIQQICCAAPSLAMCFCIWLKLPCVQHT